MSALPQPGPRRFTVDEFHLAGEVGLFKPDERLELIEGEVYGKVSPQGVRDAAAISLASRRLQSLPTRSWSIRPQLPLVLTGTTVLEPDITVVVGEFTDFFARHPERHDVLLVIEVSDSSLTLDRNRKGPLYAASGVQEFWIVNLVDDLVEVYREPYHAADGWRYGRVEILRCQQEVRPLFVPDVPILVSDLLPPKP
jgi:Uma2 family endonuclease